MRPINLIRIALRALQRNTMRTILTMLGIIIGVAAVITMMSIGEGSKQSIHESLSSMGSNMISVLPYSNVSGGVRLAGSSVQTLTLGDVEAIRKNAPDVAAVSPLFSTSGQAIKGSLNWATVIQGGSLEYMFIKKLEVKDGIMFSDEDVRESAKVCLLGQTVVKNLFTEDEEPIGQIIRFNKVPLKVIGTLVEKGQNNFGQDQDDIIIAPYTTVQKRLLSTIYMQALYASASSEQTSDSATEEITNILRQTHRLRPEEANDFTVRTQQELIKTLSSTGTMLTKLLIAVASISLFIGGIGIMNIMYVSVTERTREIGLRMSIGARGRDILLQFLLEAIVISVTGGMIGVTLGVGTSVLIASLSGWPVIISRSSIVLSFGVCAITGVFFGYYPAQKASKLDPIEALRYE